MKNKIKGGLRKIYKAPPPERKREFFHQMDAQPINTRYILRSQVIYISKLEWVLSIALFAVTAITSYFSKMAVFGTALALVPFLAAAGISESMRSEIYGMDELEMAARFSLKSVILARMCIVGIENLILVLSSALFIQGEMLFTMLYLAVPYFVTVYGSLLIVRSLSRKEGIYVCIGYSAAVSLAFSFGFLNYAWIYQEQFLRFWVAALLLFIFADFKEGRRFIRAACYTREPNGLPIH